MTISLDELTTPVTRDQAKQSIYDVMAAVGLNTTTWKPGAVVRTMVTAVAIVISALSSLIALIARSGFLDLSTGAWLTLVAQYVYAVARIDASFASGVVKLVNTAGGVYVLAVDDLIVANPTSGKTYRNTTGFTIGALQTVYVPVVAVEAGSASSSAGNTITQLVTTLLGVTVTNDDGLVGTDEESDTDLRARCRDKLGSLSPNGPWDAYSYAAKTATRADGSNVGVTRVRLIKNGFGRVDVYCATASGAVPGVNTDPSTDLGAIDAAIQDRAAPLAVTATAFTAVPVVVGVTYQIWMYNTSALTVAQVHASVQARLSSYAALVPVGGNVIDNDPGKVFVDTIESEIRFVSPAEIFRVEVTLPAADIQLAGSEVWVLGSVISLGINQIAPPSGSS